MATIKHIFKGESLSLLFTFPALYDMSRIEKHEIYIGATKFAGVVSGQTIELKLTSQQTDVMYGKQEIRLWLDDAILGVKKPYCGDIIVSNSNAKPANDSTSSVSDIIIPIVISETAITVGDILYNYVKGDPFKYSDFTPEQLEALKVKGDKFEFSDFTSEQIALLQKPASDIATTVSNAEGLRVTAETNRNNAEGLRLSAEIIRNDNEANRIEAERLRAGAETSRQTAEGQRVTAEQARQTNTATAIQNAETATTNAGNAASLANEKAGLADTKAGLADQKATLADNAATNANTKAGLADTAATNANNVANTYASELAAKELKANKQNSLAPDGTGTKFPTVDAVNGIVNLKYTSSELISGYYNTSGSTFIDVLYAHATYRTAKISAIGIDKIVFAGTSGSSARAIAIFDVNGNSLYKSSASVTSDTVDVFANYKTASFIIIQLNSAFSGEFNITVSPRKNRENIITLNDSNTLLSGRVTTLEGLSGGLLAPKYKNNPYPFYKSTLKILAIGNSYTVDGSEYLPDIIDSSGLDKSKLAVYISYISSADLTTWADKYDSTDSISLIKRGGDINMAVTTGTFKQILTQDWDIIVIQQFSNYSINYNTYNPGLKRLIADIRLSCQQNIAIAFNLVHSYWTGYGTAPYGVDRWAAICSSVKQMVLSDGIDIIIPTGTAIQNARNTTLQTTHDITRDGNHLSFGVGRYIAACTWYQTLIAPFFNKSVIGNSAIHTITEAEIISPENLYESVNVTLSNNLLCQKSAFYATIDKFNLTTIL